MHVLDHGREADRHAGKSQRSDDVADVALSEPLVVGLGEHLSCEQLVGDLGVRSAVVGVVDRLALWIPLAKLPACAGRHGAQLLAHEIVSLGIDVDDTEPALDCGERQQDLQNCLAGPSCAEV